MRLATREPPRTREESFTMDEYESLSHTKWECKYHVVFIPKCRRKTLYGELRRHLGEVPHAGGAEGESDRRRAFATGSRRHDDRDSTEVRGVPGGGFHQGQECDSFGPGGWRAEAKFCGQHFWAGGHLCVPSGSG